MVESAAEGPPAWITIRDAATLQPTGSAIEPEGFTGSFISQYWTDPNVALTPDGRSLVTTSAEGELAWWDLDSREKTRTIEIEDGYRALALSPDGRTAAIGLDGGIRLIDVRTGAAREAKGALASTPIGLLFSPDGKTVVSTNVDGTVTLWDAGAATPSETLRGHLRSVWQPVFSPDGDTLYTASSDGTAIAWDLSGDRRLGETVHVHARQRAQRLAGPAPGEVQPGRPADRRRPQRGRDPALGCEKAHPSRCAPAGDRRRGHGARVQSGRADACGRHQQPGLATIWDLESRSLRQGPFQVASYAVGVSISADGTMLATAGGGGVKLWDVATGAALGRIGDGRNAGDVAFSPTEPLVAFIVDGYLQSGGGDAEIWDVARRSLVTTLHIDAADVLGWAVAFSPDGRMLATGGNDPLVHLWDVRTGKLIRELEQNVGNAVWALEFSPDGRILAISGGDSFASLWDVATGAQIGPRLGVGSREAMLDLSPDGRRLLMTSGNGQGAVWDIDPESWAQRACALANRTLTREEWEEFLPGRPYEPACASRSPIRGESTR